MTKSLVLTFIGHDKPGLVNAISEAVAGAGANWHESRLARLGGEFAGIVLITVREAELAALTSALRGLEKSGLRITLETSSAALPTSANRTVELNLVGHDRPGIVREVTQALSQLHVNIEEFTSSIESAPFTGETMFHAMAELHLPDGVSQDQVKEALERLADEIMVDLIIHGGE